MDKKWRIKFYKTTTNNSPVDDFVDKLDIKTQNKIVEVLNLLKEFGINLGLPHAKKLTGTPLWELRILGGDNIRIFYITQPGKTFLFMHGFQKKKQKTDKREINIALDRLVDYKLRTRN